MSGSRNESIKMAPFRSMNDFILDSSKYLSPPFNDLKRFSNRASSNLLYYQTNYFCLSAVVFLLFVLFGFNKMLLGAFGIATTGATVMFAQNKIPQLASIRAQYPIAIVGLGIFNLVIVYTSFRPILYFLLSIVAPMAMWVAHASTRSRGIKNKINNKVEQIGGQVYTNSPMGILLSAVGVELKDSDE